MITSCGKLENSSGSVHTAVGTKTNIFAFKILAVTNIDLRFGFGQVKTINNNSSTNFQTSGNYYYYIYSGYKYVNGSVIFCVTGGASLEYVGVTFGMKYNKKKKNIELFRGSSNLGVIYDNLPKNLKLLPCIDMSQSGGSVEFIKPEFK